MRVNEQKELTRRVIQILQEILQMVKICDLIKIDTQANFKQRERMSIKEKQEFLLEKLYEIKDNQFYSLIEICEGNGLRSDSPNEVYEIAGNLAKQGLINTVKGAGAIITLEGRIFVEEILQKRQSLQSYLDSVTKELGIDSRPELLSLKTKLKQQITCDLDNDLFDKLDLLIAENGSGRDNFSTIRGRFSTLLSSRIRGIIAYQDDSLETSRIRNSLILWIDSLNSNDLRNQPNLQS